MYNLKYQDITGFGLMLMRVGTFVALTPIFGNRSVPQHVKILLSLIICMVTYPVLKGYFKVPEKVEMDIIALVIREVFIGVMLGFLTRLIFMGVEVSGQILSISMGFNSVSLINPTFNESNLIMDQFEIILGTLLFLSINGHHMFIEAIYRSFELAPVGMLTFNLGAISSVSQFATDVFVIGIKLTGPMLAVILFLNLALGIVGRAVPQINVFVISFPVNILVGLFVFVVSIPLLLSVMESDFVQMGAQVFTFLKGF